jgi:integrase
MKARYGGIQLVTDPKSSKLYFQFRHEGKQRKISSSLDDTAKHRKHCERLIGQMELDRLAGIFDASLAKYLGVSRNTKTVLEPKPKPPGSVLSLYQQWVKSLCLTDRTANGHYKAIESMVNRWGSITIDQIAEQLQAEKLSSITFNQRKTYLKRLLDWAVDEKLIDSNPLARLKSKRSTSVRLQRQPFTNAEIGIILEAFRTNSCCSPKSAFKHDQYYPFVKFLFYTGCRISEAIGLRVKDVNLKTGEIEIGSVLARSDTGKTSAQNRTRKETKTGSIRKLQMNDILKELVKDAASGKRSDDLLFITHKGNAIDDHSFSQRVWKPILEKLGIAYRVPYAARHTLATRAIENGVPINQVSYILGHSNVQTTLSFYTHKSNPGKLPELY